MTDALVEQPINFLKEDCPLKLKLLNGVEVLQNKIVCAIGKKFCSNLSVVSSITDEEHLNNCFKDNMKV